jgi:hypothetical protein
MLRAPTEDSHGPEDDGVEVVESLLSCKAEPRIRKSNTQNIPILQVLPNKFPKLHVLL